MKLSLNWLQDYIDTSDLTAEELADKLALSGTEVENIFKQGAGLDNVIVAHIKAIRPHPNADRLVLCDVYTGTETVQIVCGAKNMKEGGKVALTLPGAVLPNGLEIKKSKIRGESSAGMLASATELGLGQESSGIMILDPSFEPGTKFSEALGLNDTILELEITPNRPDTMSMIGMAREIGAILKRDYKIPNIEAREDVAEAFRLPGVEIKDADLCPRYIAKIITDVKVGESPDWLKNRLIAAGARPINNLVDITNYILFEVGQPLHAFDYEQLEGGQIIVRRARKGEKITTLDDIERPLIEDNLVIADAKRAVAIAGVMGGANTEVSEKTKVVLLESAYFKPVSVGKTSRNLGLISESSIRFERGVDPNQVAYAADRAAQLLQEIASGQALKGSVDVYPSPIKPKKIKLRTARANSIIGIDLKSKEMAAHLSSLDLEVIENSSHLEVNIPTFRPDLEREIDLIEEIARLNGLNNITSTLPGVAQVGSVTKMDELQDKIRNQLVGFGLKEAITYSFIDPSLLSDYPAEYKNALKLKNPLSAEQSVMRTTLLPGLISSLDLNIARGQKDVWLFEMGTVFIPSKGLPDEQKHLGIIINKKEIDFFDAKGIVEAILKSLLISESLNFESYKHNLFNPLKCFKLRLGEEELGLLGELSTKAVYLELNLGLLLKLNRQLAPFKAISVYPAITLDVAILVDKSVKHAEIVRSIKEMGGDLLANIEIFDIYEGETIDPGKKSMAYSLTYQSMERTLELGEAEKIHESIKQNLKKDLSAVIR